MREIALQSLSVYIVTLVIVKGDIFNSLRTWLRPRTSWLITGETWLFSCRLCVAFWVAILVTTMYSNIMNVLPVYGLAHFLNMIERK